MYKTGMGALTDLEEECLCAAIVECVRRLAPGLIESGHADDPTHINVNAIARPFPRVDVVPTARS